MISVGFEDMLLGVELLEQVDVTVEIGIDKDNVGSGMKETIKNPMINNLKNICGFIYFQRFK
jgi:hypothetical protein